MSFSDKKVSMKSVQPCSRIGSPNLASARNKWPAPCKNVSSDIKCMRQRRRRSDCAFVQSDLGLHCPLTESLDAIECINGEKMPG